MQKASETGKSMLFHRMNGSIREGTLERIARYAAYLYIGVPIVIFLLGWMRWYIGVPLALIVAVSFFLCFRDEARAPIVGDRTVPLSALGAMLLLACAWVYLSGIGGYVYQNFDHLYRNEIFKILVEYPWPPTKTLATGSGYQTVLISYYIGFWLPAALVGKVLGLKAGFAFQYVWAVTGLLTLFVLLSKRVRKWNAATVLAFIFFSGLDIVGCLLVGEDIFAMNIQEHIEWWSGYQFSSHMTDLFWVFNQAIYGWLLTMLILDEADNKRLVLFWSCGLLECTFPFVGMLPFLGYKILSNIQWKGVRIKDFLKWTNKLFSFENVLGGGVIGIVSFLYLFGNQSSGASYIGLLRTRPTDIFMYLLFIFMEAGVFSIAIFRYEKKNPLYWISLLALAACPLIRIGGSADFCMRASIPPLLVLFLLVTKSLYRSWTENRRLFYGLLAIILIGAVTPLHELVRTTAQTASIHRSNGSTVGYVDEDSVFSGANFTAAVSSSRFAKYFTDLKELWPYGKIDGSGGVVGEITDDRLVEQRFMVQDDITIDSIGIVFATYIRTNDCTMDIVIVDDSENATNIAVVDCSKLEDNTTRFIDILPYHVQKDRWYSVQFISHGASPENAVTIYRSAGEGEDWKCAVIDGEIQDYDLAVGFGRREVKSNESNSTRRRFRHADQ